MFHIASVASHCASSLWPAAVQSPAGFLHRIGYNFIIVYNADFVKLLRSPIDPRLKGRGRFAFHPTTHLRFIPFSPQHTTNQLFEFICLPCIPFPHPSTPTTSSTRTTWTRLLIMANLTWAQENCFTLSSILMERWHPPSRTLTAFPTTNLRMGDWPLPSNTTRSKCRPYLQGRRVRALSHRLLLRPH